MDSRQALHREATLYSLLHRGNAGDVEFYAVRCAEVESALELGVGYGRVGVPLAVHGVAVTGLDLHSGLLAMAEQAAREAAVQQRFQARLCDMRDFGLKARFERVLIPYTGLFCLLSEEDVMRCLVSCKQHLVPEGRLIFDVYEADSFHQECDPTDMAESELEPVVELQFAGQRLMVYERSSWHKPTQRLDVHYEYFDEAGILVHATTVRQRYMLVAQIERMLANAGFSDVNVWGGFRGEAVSATSDAVVFEATLG